MTLNNCTFSFCPTCFAKSETWGRLFSSIFREVFSSSWYGVNSVKNVGLCYNDINKIAPTCTVKIHPNLAVVWCQVVAFFFFFPLVVKWPWEEFWLLWLDGTSRPLAVISEISLLWHPVAWSGKVLCLGNADRGLLHLPLPKLDCLLFLGLVWSSASYSCHPTLSSAESSNFNWFHQAEGASCLMPVCVVFGFYCILNIDAVILGA